MYTMTVNPEYYESLLLPQLEPDPTGQREIVSLPIPHFLRKTAIWQLPYAAAEARRVRRFQVVLKISIVVSLAITAGFIYFACASSVNWTLWGILVAATIVRSVLFRLLRPAGFPVYKRGVGLTFSGLPQDFVERVAEMNPPSAVFITPAAAPVA
ncbi:hypothetical protein GCM10009682_19220 [Luedemannella flava]|uniref:Uncharacterized protein n=1 Tax=Luedemannella flava TaxID=349316 RepID=A0ABP4Y0A1_9ACTN